MGGFIDTMQNHVVADTVVIACNLALIKEPIGKVKELLAGFRMLCDSFAISLKEFQ